MQPVVIGTYAPALVLHAVPEESSNYRVPRVLAFLRGWSVEHESPGSLQALRAQLRGLGAELTILSDSGVWSFRPDDEIEELGASSDRLAADIELAAGRYGVRGEGIFVIDGKGLVRFAHRSDAAFPSSEPHRHPAVLPAGRRSRPSTLAEALAAAHEAMLHRSQTERVLFTRREWTLTCLVTGCALAFLGGCKQQDKRAPAARVEPAPSDVPIVLTVNGARRELRVDPRASLLDTLRERLGLTGTKKGCDMGQCGACTVLLDGKRVNACLTLAVMAQGAPITTIEGLAHGGQLHPMQRAFIEHDGLQCGYCTPGQILSAVALLSEGRATTDAEVRQQMSGNICRCGAYPNIVAAIQAARKVRS